MTNQSYVHPMLKYRESETGAWKLADWKREEQDKLAQFFRILIEWDTVVPRHGKADSGTQNNDKEDQRVGDGGDVSAGVVERPRAGGVLNSRPTEAPPGVRSRTS